MQLVNRFHKVRALYPNQGYSRPYIIDRKWGKILPDDTSREWYRTPEGFHIPVQSGGIYGPTPFPDVFGFRNPVSLTTTVHILSSAYTAGSAGAAYGVRFIPHVSSTITNLYCYIQLLTGTPAALNYEIRSGTLSTPDTSGPGLLASGTWVPGGILGWQKISGLSLAVTADTIYWIIFADADGSGTDNARLLRDLGGVDSRYAMSLSNISSVTTSNGFSTVTTGAEVPSIVIVLANGHVVGNACAIVSASTNNALQRGGYLSDLDTIAGGVGLNTTLKLHGLVFGAGSNNISGAKIYAGLGGPATSPLYTSTATLVDNSNAVNAVLFITSTLLVSGTIYRIVLTYSGSAAEPKIVGQGTGADSNTVQTFPGKGNWYWTQDTAGSWVDSIDSIPLMGLIIDDFDANAVAFAPAAPGRSFPKPG